MHFNMDNTFDLSNITNPLLDGFTTIIIRADFKPNYYLWTLAIVFLTFSYLFLTMAAESASSFNIVPEGKSWADIVEEDEEYDRLQHDQDFSEERDQIHDANTSVDTTSQTTASLLEKEETRGKKECMPVTNADVTTATTCQAEKTKFDAENKKKLETENHAKLINAQNANMEDEQKAQEQKALYQVDEVQENAVKDLNAKKESTNTEEVTIKEEPLIKDESNVGEKSQALESKIEEKSGIEGFNVDKDSKVQESKIEESNVEDEPKSEITTTEESKAKEVKDEEPKAEVSKVEEPIVEEPKAEEPKVETPKPTGSMASKWATAASDPPTSRKQQSPRTMNAEVPSTSNSFKTGSMLSKWASASDEPPTRNHRRYDNYDRYSSNDRYNSRYNTSDRYGSGNHYGSGNTGRWNLDHGQGNEQRSNIGRLNRDYFEEKRPNENRGTFESRLNKADFENPTDRYYDNADGRNGGFDNKENFSRVNRYNDYVERTKPGDISNTPEVQEAINAWNTYKAPEDDDENDKKEVNVEEMKSEENDKVPTEDTPETIPLVEQASPKADQVPLKDVETLGKPIEEQTPSTFSWADDLPEDESESEELFNLPVSSWGSLEAPSAATPKDDNIATAPEDDTAAAPKDDNNATTPKDDNSSTAPEDDTAAAPKDDIAIAQKEETPIDSLEKNRSIQSWDNVETTDKPSQIEQAPVIEEKAVFTWGALDDYKEPVKPITPTVSDELPQLSEDQKEAAILAWNTVKLPEINDEGEEITETEIETASVSASASVPLIEQNEEPEASNSWNGESGWNTIGTTEEPVPEIPSWKVDPTPAAEESSINNVTHSKQDWRSQLPPVVEDNASKWKSFADSIDVPPPRPAARSPRPTPVVPPAVKEEPAHSWQSAPIAAKEEPVQSWQSTPAAAKEEPVHSWQSTSVPTDAPTNTWQSTPIAALDTPQLSFAAPITVQKPETSQPLIQTPSSLPQPQASSPQFQHKRSPMQVNFSFAESEKQPINVSFSMSELVTEPVKKVQNVSLSLSEFSDQPPARQPVNVSFSLSEFSNVEPETKKKPTNNNTNDAPMSWGDFARTH